MWQHVEGIINLAPIENESLLINGNPSHFFNMFFDVSNRDERRGERNDMCLALQVLHRQIGVV